MFLIFSKINESINYDYYLAIYLSTGVFSLSVSVYGIVLLKAQFFLYIFLKQYNKYCE